MPRLRAHNIAVSVDGYAAGPSQDVDNPMGVGGGGLHRWAMATRSFRAAHGDLDTATEDAGSEGAGSEGADLDDAFIVAGDEGIGATIMGRNMFGPGRGAWDMSWTGWWGDEPPYHHPVFVLTHHPRPPLEMAGGTTFHFVTEGIEAARKQALDAADGRDVRVGGGASTIQQYLRAGLLDELHVAIVPILLGAGERLFDNLDGGPGDLSCVEFVSSPGVTHVRFARTS